VGITSRKDIYAEVARSWYNAQYMEKTGTPLIETPVHQEYEDEEEPTEARMAQAALDRRTAGLFKAGVSGNPAGRPKGKSLKEWGREYLAGLSDEERFDFFSGIAKIDLWKMIEGNPTEDRNIKVSIPTPILGGITQEHTQLPAGTDNTEPT
jgi:hypothetical protein